MPEATTSSDVYDELRLRIVRGDLLPGDKVPQLKISKQLGCSTIPVVEALRRLESEGLLSKEPRRIAHVRQLDQKDLLGLYLVREGMECAAVRLAAENSASGSLDWLYEENNQYERYFSRGDFPSMCVAELKIHKGIASLADCPLLVSELDRLLLIERTSGLSPGVSSAERSSYSGHGPIIQAIEDNDGEMAEFLMKKHIQAGYAELGGRWGFPE